MPRKRQHPLKVALDAIGRKPSDIEHFICEGDRLEVFFSNATVPHVIAPSSPYARPLEIPPGYSGEHDRDADTGPVEATDLLVRS